MDTIDDFESNPWKVKNLDDFLYYNCPECHVRDQSKVLFLQHALEEHPKAKECLSEFTTVKEELFKGILTLRLKTYVMFNPFRKY